jgi:hypothetical protein
MTLRIVDLEDDPFDRDTASTASRRTALLMRAVLAKRPRIIMLHGVPEP